MRNLIALPWFLTTDSGDTTAVPRQEVLQDPLSFCLDLTFYMAIARHAMKLIYGQTDRSATIIPRNSIAYTPLSPQVQYKFDVTAIHLPVLLIAYLDLFLSKAPRFARSKYCP